MRKTMLTIFTAAMLAGASVGAAFAQGAGGGGAGGGGAGAGGAGAGAGAGAGSGGAGSGSGSAGDGSGSGSGGITHTERGGQGASSAPGMRNETTPRSNGTTPQR